MHDKLQRFYNAREEKILVPFLGAGMSMPFANINWVKLIELIAQQEKNYAAYKDELHQCLDKMLYDEALELIRYHAKYDNFEKTLKRRVSRIYKELQESLKDKFNQTDNNYIDLLKQEFRTFFTFNYDHFLESVSESFGRMPHPKVLSIDSMDSQFIDKDNRDPVVWHVHGDYETINSIVLSPKSYTKTYKDKNFQSKLSFIINHFVFFFIGVSFNDTMIQKFFYDNREVFEKNTHYILFGEEEDIDESELCRKYGLIVLRYCTENGHVEGIRQLLLQLLKVSEDGKSEEDSGKQQGHYVNITSTNGGTSNVNFGTINNTYHINASGGNSHG